MPQTCRKKYKDLENGAETEDCYSVAGRVMVIRNSGMFIDLVDPSGKIQIFSHKENLNEDQMKLLNSLISVISLVLRAQSEELRAVNFLLKLHH